MPHDEPQPAAPSGFAFYRKLVLLLTVSVSLAWAGRFVGLDPHQQVAAGVFLAAILGTLLFWNLRLSIAFLGVSVLILTRSLTVEQYVESAELPLILFLVGMMIILGCLEDLGFFTWVVQSLLSIPRLTGRRFLAVLSLAAAILACVVDEVTSIVIIGTLIFQVCHRLKLNPAPFVIAAVLATNIGSSGTMIGNPVGILIGSKAGFTFGDFLIWAFPIMLICLAANILLSFVVFRHTLRRFDEAIRLTEGVGPRVAVPFGRSALVLGTALLCIALHHQGETRFGLERNALLYMAPLFCAALVMLYRRDRARHYVEHAVDWWTLLFFLMFFTIAGALKHSGIAPLLAHRFTGTARANYNSLIALVTTLSGLGSAFVDNVVFVAAFAPIIEGFRLAGLAVSPLWWALLFGACYGGNITLIGSTANIVALGMLEKQARAHIRFWEWLRVGVLSALVSGVIAAAALMLVRNRMPEPLAASLDSLPDAHAVLPLPRPRVSDAPAPPPAVAFSFDAAWRSPGEGPAMGGGLNDRPYLVHPNPRITP